jgi:hypothetical protein
LLADAVILNLPAVGQLATVGVKIQITSLVTFKVLGAGVVLFPVAAVLTQLRLLVGAGAEFFCSGRLALQQNCHCPVPVDLQ